MDLVIESLGRDTTICVCPVESIVYIRVPVSVLTLFRRLGFSISIPVNAALLASTDADMYISRTLSTAEVLKLNREAGSPSVVRI